MSLASTAENMTENLSRPDGFGVRGSLIGLILSSALYGVAMLIAFTCCRLLGQSKQLYYSRKRLIALYVHTGFMLACATEAIISESWLTVRAIDQRLTMKINPATVVNLIPITLPLTVWGADGLLIWRCLVLFGGISGIKRIMLYIFLGSLALMKLAGGIVFFHYASPGHATDKMFRVVQLLVFSMTSAGNVLVSGVIATRLLYAEQKSVAFREPGSSRSQSPYMRALIVCVESSGLIAIAALLGLILTVTLSQQYNQIVPMVFPQLCVISPLLITHRISRGREARIIREQETQDISDPIAFMNATIVREHD